jgi:hypothetical protein
MMNLFEVAKEIADRLSRIFLQDDEGRRPVYGGSKTFQKDPHWRDYILFYEYFHGDNGAGLGASHHRLDRARGEDSRALRLPRRGAYPGDRQAGRLLRERFGGRSVAPCERARNMGLDRVGRLRCGLAHGRLGAQPGACRDFDAQRGASPVGPSAALPSVGTGKEEQEEGRRLGLRAQSEAAEPPRTEPRHEASDHRRPFLRSSSRA